ncbi:MULTISPECIES: hypothetical protein [unclassified Roseovarius]|uniref:hypothetical protein n=1 Tax=unclassified Roseovarius TaxID=2614913 RepID=UPI002740192C|nr:MULTISPECIES: hypothetical protein [unclassified Roseovarius]
MRREALEYLKENWHVGIVGSAEAATFLRIKPNTLRTRIARDQALSLRDESGRQRAAVTFTGYHLVYNLIQDRLIRFGVPLEPKSGEGFAEAYTDWVESNVLKDPFLINAMVRFDNNDDGAVSHLFERGGIEDWTGDAALILPIGTMVFRLAISLYVKSGRPDVVEILSNARELVSDKPIPITHPDE